MLRIFNKRLILLLTLDTSHHLILTTILGIQGTFILQRRKLRFRGSCSAGLTAAAKADVTPPPWALIRATELPTNQVWELNSTRTAPSNMTDALLYAQGQRSRTETSLGSCWAPTSTLKAITAGGWGSVGWGEDLRSRDLAAPAHPSRRPRGRQADVHHMGALRPTTHPLLEPGSEAAPPPHS